MFSSDEDTSLSEVLNSHERYISRCRSAAARLAVVSGWSPNRKRVLSKLISRHAKDLRTLRKTASVCEGLNSKLVRKRNRVLQSFSARACGALYSAAQLQRKGGKVLPLRWEEFERNLAQCPTRTGRCDSTIIHPVKKASGGTRIIVNPGPRTRSAHYTIRQVHEALGWRSPYDYNSLGKGRRKALLAIREMIETGTSWLVRFDIENFFPSVKPQHLQKQLRLPAKVNSTLFMQSASPVLYKGMKAKSARHGLPQGAPASDKIASAFLGRELREICGTLAKVTYVDDGVIGAQGHSEAEQVAKALHTRLAELSGGPIGLKHIQICNAQKGLEFLGYWIKTAETDDGTMVSFWPSHSSKMKFQRELFKRMRTAGPNLVWEDAIILLESYRTAWKKAFDLWTPSEAAWEDFVACTECWVADYLSGTTKKTKPVLSYAIGA